ncbi:MAG: ABC transporter substrate-binding protein [SAR202 cluster bacterium]|nr:ABC transporter substrate-binding protein [SAR202 cluster bacterium]
MTLLLAVILACGSSATATPGVATPSTGSSPTIVPTSVPPTATVVPADAPTASTEPSGTLNIGQKELGPYQGHPKLAGNPQIFLNQVISAENLVAHSSSSPSEFLPMLAESWSISADSLSWTFKIRKGVQFHQGYGEMTAEDVLWSIDQIIESAKHPGSSDVARMWQNEKGSRETPDPYTIVLNTGVPAIDVLNRVRNPWAGSTWVASKKQSDEIGEEAANDRTALTGPWAFDDAETSQFWRFQAVFDHWRQTPYFREMVLWEIPEESARVAGFQTGQLDTFTMAFDSITTVEGVPGALFMAVPGGGESHLGLYGSSYVGLGTDDQRPNWNPELPWVATTDDVTSPEWERALKVRQALAISIDRQSIVDNLLKGFGKPSVMWGWLGNEDKLDPDMTWEFDPVKAGQLLDEAGYPGPDRFSLTLTPSIRGAPSEVEACEAVSQMWSDIGINVQLQNLPYSTLRPTLIARTYEGITCHATSPRIEPFLGYTNWWSRAANWYAGVEHPWLEENMPLASTLFDADERWVAQKEVGRFLYDNALDIGLYDFDVIWPLSSNVASWKENIRLGDTRNINGMEFAKPR